MEASEIDYRFEEMVDVLSRMPPAIKRQKFTSWIDYVNDPNTAYGYSEVKLSRPKPTPKQIDRMDQALMWINMLETKEEQRLIWARAHKFPLRKIAGLMGISKDTVKYRWMAALVKLSYKKKKKIIIYLDKSDKKCIGFLYNADLFVMCSYSKV